MQNAINIDTRKVGGLRWIRIGRLTIALSVAPAYRPLGSTEKRAKAKRPTWAKVDRWMQRAFDDGMRVATRNLTRNA